MEYQIGQVVYSKSGRDKGLPMLVVDLDGDFMLLSDGRRRKIDKPKKKKVIHLQPTHNVDDCIATKINNKELVLNSDIRTVLEKFKK